MDSIGAWVPIRNLAQKKSRDAEDLQRRMIALGREGNLRARAFHVEVCRFVGHLSLSQMALHAAAHEFRRDKFGSKKFDIFQPNTIGIKQRSREELVSFAEERLSVLSENDRYRVLMSDEEYFSRDIRISFSQRHVGIFYSPDPISEKNIDIELSVHHWTGAILDFEDGSVVAPGFDPLTKIEPRRGPIHAARKQYRIYRGVMILRSQLAQLIKRVARPARRSPGRPGYDKQRTIVDELISSARSELTSCKWSEIRRLIVHRIELARLPMPGKTWLDDEAKRVKETLKISGQSNQADSEPTLQA